MHTQYTHRWGVGSVTRAREGFPVTERNHYRYNEPLEEKGPMYTEDHKKVYNDKNRPGGLRSWIRQAVSSWDGVLQGKLHTKQPKQQLECSVARGKKEGCSKYFPLVSYMTHLTTRGLAPCPGTPCNELGYCPSLGLPALELCNTAYEIETRGMRSKFTLYCQLTPGLWSRMCNFHPMGWCSTIDGEIAGPVTDNTSREDFRARHLVHFSQLLA